MLLFGFALSFSFANPYAWKNVEANGITTKNDNSLYAETSHEFQVKAEQQANKITKDPDAPRKSSDAEYVASKKTTLGFPSGTIGQLLNIIILERCRLIIQKISGLLKIMFFGINTM